MEEFLIFMTVGMILFIPSIIINGLAMIWLNKKQARFERKIIKQVIEILKTKETLN